VIVAVRSSLYRDPIPWPKRADVQLDSDEVQLELPDGRKTRHSLDGFAPQVMDGFVVVQGRVERRFVRMLVLERYSVKHVYVTPPDTGAVAPSVVRVPEAPKEAVILETAAFDSFSEWVIGGGRLAAFSIPDLARLAQIASPSFAALIGEVVAQRALEIAWEARGPLRDAYAGDADASLQPLVLAAKHSPRAAEALVAALSLLAVSRRRRRRRAY
jgi:hypothetical protein